MLHSNRNADRMHLCAAVMASVVGVVATGSAAASDLFADLVGSGAQVSAPATFSGAGRSLDALADALSPRVSTDERVVQRAESVEMPPNPFESAVRSPAPLPLDDLAVALAPTLIRSEPAATDAVEPLKRAPVIVSDAVAKAPLTADAAPGWSTVDTGCSANDLAAILAPELSRVASEAVAADLGPVASARPAVATPVEAAPSAAVSAEPVWLADNASRSSNDLAAILAPELSRVAPEAVAADLRPTAPAQLEVVLEPAVVAPAEQETRVAVIARTPASDLYGAYSGVAEEEPAPSMSEQALLESLVEVGDTTPRVAEAVVNADEPLDQLFAPNETFQWVAAESSSEIVTPEPTLADESPLTTVVESAPVYESYPGAPRGYCRDQFRYDRPLSDQVLPLLNVDTRPMIRESANTDASRRLANADDLEDTYLTSALVAYQDATPVANGCPRFDGGYCYYWLAPSVFHRPLYFEQVGVERYGHYVHSDCVQSAVSAAHFFGSVAILPYKMGAHPHQTCDYTLGRYRPGSCNPRTLSYERINPRGVVLQGLAVTGLVFLIP